MMGWGVPEEGWRKGPWTPEEDKLLHQYVNLHGDGKWSSVAKSTGLKRSGKSCRLRWVNYLRPGLKRGQITPQEEAIIVELHSLWGNKWSTIAQYLPGRTDNEIKNYWRTHFKKKEKCSQTQKERRKEYQLLKQKQKQKQDDTAQMAMKMCEDHDCAGVEASSSNEKNDAIGEENNMVLMYQSNYEPSSPVMSQSQDMDVVAYSWSESFVGEEGLWDGLWNLDDSWPLH